MYSRQLRVGRYTMLWDKLMGTYRQWTKPTAVEDYDVYAALDRLNGIKPPLPATPAWCTPEACKAAYTAAMKTKDAPACCVVVGGNGLVGRCGSEK